MNGVGLVEGCLVVVLDEREYALYLDDVVEVLLIVALQPVPQAPDWLLGLANVRGDTLPVVDMRARFGLGPTPMRLSTPIVVVRRGDRLLGLVVDAAREVLSLPPGAAASPDDLVTGGVIVGIVRHENRTIPILDIALLFDATATIELPGSDWTGRSAKESNALG